MNKSIQIHQFDQRYPGGSGTLMTRALHAVWAPFANLICALQSPGGF